VGLCFCVRGRTRADMITSRVQIYREGARSRVAFVEACADAIGVQCAALDAALSNLRDHAKALAKSHAQFHAQFQQQQASQSKLLDTAEADMMKLAETKLHAAFQREGRETLLDCVPVAKLRLWSKECGVSHAALRQKVDSLSEFVQTLRSGVDTELAQLPISEVQCGWLVLLVACSVCVVCCTCPPGVSPALMFAFRPSDRTNPPK